MVVGSNSMSEHQLTDRSNRHHHSSSRYMGMKGNELMQHHKAAMESDESEDDELPILPRQPIPDSELTPQYWLLLKIVKYIKFGSRTATLLALCGLSRYDLTGQPMFQQALENSEAIDVLVNVLEADDHKCKVAALRLLQQLVTVQHFQRLLVIKSGIATIVRLLSESERDVRCLAAITLANAVNNHRSRMLTRKAGAVPLLVDLLDISRETGSLAGGGILGGSAPLESKEKKVAGSRKKKAVPGKKKEITIVSAEAASSAAEMRQQKIRAATAASKALRSLSCSRAVRRDLYLAGGIPLLTQLTTTTVTAPPPISSSIGHHSGTVASTPNTALQTPGGPIPQSASTAVGPTVASLLTANSQQPANKTKAMTTAGKWTKRSTLKSRMSSHIFISAAEIQQQILNRQLEYELLIAVTGVIHQCAADEMFRKSVKADLLLSQLLRLMRLVDCDQLQTLCASTIAYFAEDEPHRRVLTQLKAADTLSFVIKQSELTAQQLHKQMQMDHMQMGPSAGGVTTTVLQQPEDQQRQQTMSSIQQSMDSEVNKTRASSPSSVAARTQQMLSYSHHTQPLPVNLPLLRAVSTAIWKLAASNEAREKFRQLGILAIFVRQLNQPTEEVLLPIVSAISVIATDSESLTLLHVEQAVPRFVWLLSCNHPGLLSAAALTIANLTSDTIALQTLEMVDAARLLWSLLKHPASAVQAGAASAIAAFSARSKRSGEVARSLVGGLELLVSLLRAPDLNVVTAAAAAVARMATEDETLAVLSDHHVVALLANLVRTKNRNLKLRVAEAIAECCRWPGNPTQLGRGGGVKPLVRYLRSKRDVELKRAAARALHQVSSDRDNCFILHQHGAVMLLLKLVGCGDADIQAAAAGCLSNIRTFIHSLPSPSPPPGD